MNYSLFFFNSRSIYAAIVTTYIEIGRILVGVGPKYSINVETPVYNQSYLNH